MSSSRFSILARETRTDRVYQDSTVAARGIPGGVFPLFLIVSCTTRETCEDLIRFSGELPAYRTTGSRAVEGFTTHPVGNNKRGEKITLLPSPYSS